MSLPFPFRHEPMRSLRSLPLSLIALSVGTTLSGQAPARHDSVASLPELVVTATRSTETQSGVAGSVTVIDRSAIVCRQATTADQLLRAVPGANVVGDGSYGEEVRLNLRGFNSGFSTQRTLVLLDGRPLTDEYLGHTDLAQYPLDGIDRLEVVRGGISAAWGTSALGGALNLRARRGGPVPQTVLSGQGGSHGSYQGSLSHGRQAGALDLFVTAGASTTDGYRKNAVGDAVDWDSRHGLLNLGLSAGSASLRSITTVYHGEGTDDLFERRLTRVGEDLGVRLAHGGAGGGESQIRVYLDHLDQDLGWFGAPTVAYRQTGIGGFATHSRQLGRHRVLLGGDVRRNQAEVTEFAGRVDRAETIAAGFLQDEVSLGRFGVLLGLRVDRGGQGEASASYRAGVRFDVAAGTMLRAGVARSFRAPTLSDRFLPPTPFGPVIFVGNPDLKPETAISAEVGLVQRLGEGNRLELTGYYIRSDGFWDFIADTGAVFRARNITRVPIYGIEATLALRLAPGLHADLGYAFNDATYDRFTGNTAVEGNFVDDNVRHSGSATLTWATPGGHSLWAAGQAVGRRFTDPENTGAGRLNGYTLVSAGAALQVTGAVTLRIRGENLFDARYRTRPEFRQAGRTVFGGVSLTR